MNIISRVLAFLVIIIQLLNIPDITLRMFGIVYSSPISYAHFIFLISLIVIRRLKYPHMVYMTFYCGVLYYLISGFQSKVDFFDLIISCFKFILYCFGFYNAINLIRRHVIIACLILGAISILLDTIYFRFNDVVASTYISEYGRYSGFYLNPNVAALICSFGFAIVITVEGFYLKFLSLIFIFMGFLTLSRTFIATQILLVFIFLFFNRKYIVYVIMFVVLSIFSFIRFSTNSVLDINRLDFLVGLFSGKVDRSVIEDDNRKDQWAKFYNYVLDSPIFGNGYKSFSTSLADENGQNVHNTFLLIVGEGGVFPLFIFVLIVIQLILKSYRHRADSLVIFLLMIVFLIQCFVSHSFFDAGFLVFVLVYIINLLESKNNVVHKRSFSVLNVG